MPPDREPPAAAQCDHDAPSVRRPERFACRGRLTPSVRRAPMKATRTCFPECSSLTVLLPESFRGGCSFGVGARPDLSCQGTERADLTIVRRGKVAKPRRINLTDPEPVKTPIARGPWVPCGQPRAIPGKLATWLSRRHRPRRPRQAVP